MAGAKKPAKKQQQQPTKPDSPLWGSDWSEMDRAFDNFRRDLEKSFASFPGFSVPGLPKIPEASCDVIDEGGQLQVKMDVPGVKKNEINLNVTDNSLEVSAEHKEESQEKKKNYLRKERSRVSYYRTLPLSENVVPAKAKAKLTDGVLTINLPKSKPTRPPKKRSISVQ